MIVDFKVIFFEEFLFGLRSIANDYYENCSIILKIFAASSSFTGTLSLVHSCSLALLKIHYKVAIYRRMANINFMKNLLKVTNFCKSKILLELC